MSVEIPYIVFTVFAQIAVGSLIAMVIADYLGKGDEKTLKFLKTGSWVIIPALFIGLIGIMLHIARPIESIRALNNIGVSGTSNEVAMLSLFSTMAVIYTILWILNIKYGLLRLGFGVISGVVGLIFVIVQGKAYMLMAQPSLNMITTPLFFIITTFLLGPTIVAATLSIKYKALAAKLEPGDRDKIIVGSSTRMLDLKKEELEAALMRYLRVTLWIVLGGVIALILTIYGNLSLLQAEATSPGPTSVAIQWTLENILEGSYTTFFYLRVIIGILLAILFLAGLIWTLRKGDIAKASAFSVAIFICLLIGEVLGRTILFGANVPLHEVIPYILSI